MSAQLAYTQPPDLFKALKEEGFELPRECRDVLLVMPVDGVFVLRYEVMLTGEDLAKVGRALARMGNRNSRTIQTQVEPLHPSGFQRSCRDIRDISEVHVFVAARSDNPTDESYCQCGKYRWEQLKR